MKGAPHNEPANALKQSILNINSRLTQTLKEIIPEKGRKNTVNTPEKAETFSEKKNLES